MVQGSFTALSKQLTNQTHCPVHRRPRYVLPLNWEDIGNMMMADLVVALKVTLRSFRVTSDLPGVLPGTGRMCRELANQKLLCGDLRRARHIEQNMQACPTPQQMPWLIALT